MDALLEKLSQNPTWGFLAIVVILVITNPSVISEVTKLVDRLSKLQSPQLDTESANFNLLRLTRPPSRNTTLRDLKIAATIASAVFLLFDFYLYYQIIVSPLKQRWDISLISLVVFITLLPIFYLYYIWVRLPKKERSGKSSVFASVDLELGGDSDRLFRESQKALFDMGAIIVSLDSQTGNIKANLKGNEMMIQIERLENQRNKVIVTSDSILRSVTSDSGENRRNVNRVIHRLCYPIRVNEP